MVKKRRQLVSDAHDLRTLGKGVFTARAGRVDEDLRITAHLPRATGSGQRHEGNGAKGPLADTSVQALFYKHQLLLR